MHNSENDARGDHDAERAAESDETRDQHVAAVARMLANPRRVRRT